ncbi:MAG: HEPN domain-containing protein [Candidatus Edwardsbacteria bacterium]
MPSRHEDWLRQAERDLFHAQHALEDGDYEWTCFASQQAAEKAVKGLYQKFGADAWGHSVSVLLANLPSGIKPHEELLDVAKGLDKYYIPPRYPNSYPTGAPYEYYTKEEARRAIDYATRIISFCKDKLLS